MCDVEDFFKIFEYMANVNSLICNKNYRDSCISKHNSSVIFYNGIFKPNIKSNILLKEYSIHAKEIIVDGKVVNVQSVLENICNEKNSKKNTRIMQQAQV